MVLEEAEYVEVLQSKLEGYTSYAILHFYGVMQALACEQGTSHPGLVRHIQGVGRA